MWTTTLCSASGTGAGVLINTRPVHGVMRSSSSSSHGGGGGRATTRGSVIGADA
ncbi:MAG: hypothetical protein IPM79_38385 [Polyangiaceae bacterium]|nr:hypothetical protein [Polyangiaceae bacterium]